MQSATGHVEPLALHGFPLAAGPQHIPNAVECISVVHPGASWPLLLGRFGQAFLQLAPQIAGYDVIVYYSIFCGILCHETFSCPGLVLANTGLLGYVSFFNLLLNFRIGS